MSGIVIFGRQPVPGRVKTRLAEGIGGHAAAAVYQILLEHTLSEALATQENVVLSLADAPPARWTAPQSVRTEIQGEGSLGDRLAEAFERRFREGWERVLAIGTDCLAVSSDRLCHGLDVLREAPVVLGPASDGGYWAVGQRIPGYPIFDGVLWSTPLTLDHTRSRLHELGIQWRELELLSDVDTVGDLHLALEEGHIPVPLAARLRRAAGFGPEVSV